MFHISKPLNIRGYKNSADRKRAVAMLKKSGFTHFTCYNDAQSSNALMFCKVKIWTK